MGESRIAPFNPMNKRFILDKPPILYSFRRCPYAMRARLAIASAGIPVELREVQLRNKPQAMLTASPKGTVPVLVLQNGQVIAESLDIMQCYQRSAAVVKHAFTDSNLDHAQRHRIQIFSGSL